MPDVENFMWGCVSVSSSTHLTANGAGFVPFEMHHCGKILLVRGSVKPVALTCVRVTGHVAVAQSATGSSCCNDVGTI